MSKNYIVPASILDRILQECSEKDGLKINQLNYNQGIERLNIRQDNKGDGTSKNTLSFPKPRNPPGPRPSRRVPSPTYSPTASSENFAPSAPPAPENFSFSSLPGSANASFRSNNGNNESVNQQQQQQQDDLLNFLQRSRNNDTYTLQNEAVGGVELPVSPAQSNQYSPITLNTPNTSQQISLNKTLPNADVNNKSLQASFNSTNNTVPIPMEISSTSNQLNYPNRVFNPVSRNISSSTSFNNQNKSSTKGISSKSNKSLPKNIRMNSTSLPRVAAVATPRTSSPKNVTSPSKTPSKSKSKINSRSRSIEVISSKPTDKSNSSMESDISSLNKTSPIEYYSPEKTPSIQNYSVEKPAYNYSAYTTLNETNFPSPQKTDSQNSNPNQSTPRSFKDASYYEYFERPFIPRTDNNTPQLPREALFQNPNVSQIMRVPTPTKSDLDNFVPPTLDVSRALYDDGIVMSTPIYEHTARGRLIEPPQPEVIEGYEVSKIVSPEYQSQYARELQNSFRGASNMTIDNTIENSLQFANKAQQDAQNLRNYVEDSDENIELDATKLINSVNVIEETILSSGDSAEKALDASMGELSPKSQKSLEKTINVMDSTAQVVADLVKSIPKEPVPTPIISAYAKKVFEASKNIMNRRESVADKISFFENINKKKKTSPILQPSKTKPPLIPLKQTEKKRETVDQAIDRIVRTRKTKSSNARQDVIDRMRSSPIIKSKPKPKYSNQPIAGVKRRNVNETVDKMWSNILNAKRDAELDSPPKKRPSMNDITLTPPPPLVNATPTKPKTRQIPSISVTPPSPAPQVKKKKSTTVSSKRKRPQVKKPIPTNILNKKRTQIASPLQKRKRLNEGTAKFRLLRGESKIRSGIIDPILDSVISNVVKPKKKKKLDVSGTAKYRPLRGKKKIKSIITDPIIDAIIANAVK